VIDEDDVIARLKANVPALGSRVEGGAELTEIVRRNALPQVTPAAFVVPLGVRGGAADAATGLFRQSVDHIVAVILVVRVAGDRTGKHSLAPLRTLRAAVVEALCGWAPGDQIGAFRLDRSRLLSLNDGTAIEQIDFSIGDQLRISA
jgi:hypothetical protein